MKPVYPGMRLFLADGGTGRVVDVLTEVESDAERYLVLRVDGYFGPLRVAPYQTVAHVDTGAHLALSVQEAASLPIFDPRSYGAEVGLRSRPHRTIGVQDASSAPRTFVSGR